MSYTSVAKLFFYTKSFNFAPLTKNLFLWMGFIFIISYSNVIYLFSLYRNCHTLLFPPDTFAFFHLFIRRILNLITFKASYNHHFQTNFYFLFGSVFTRLPGTCFYRISRYNWWRNTFNAIFFISIRYSFLNFTIASRHRCRSWPIRIFRPFIVIKKFFVLLIGTAIHRNISRNPFSISNPPIGIITMLW